MQGEPLRAVARLPVVEADAIVAGGDALIPTLLLLGLASWRLALLHELRLSDAAKLAASQVSSCLEVASLKAVVVL